MSREGQIMPIDYITGGLLVLATVIITFIICYAFFDNSFTYFLYFETMLLIFFVAFGVIDFFYLSIAVLFIAIIIYQAIEPSFRGEKQ